MNLGMCRQVFVHETLEGIQHCCSWYINSGAAVLMGHNELQWRKWCDVQFHQSTACSFEGLRCCRSGQMHLLLQQS